MPGIEVASYLAVPLRRSCSPPAGWSRFKVSGSDFVTTPAPCNRPCANCEVKSKPQEMCSRKPKSYASREREVAHVCCVSENSQANLEIIRAGGDDTFLLPREVLIAIPGFASPPYTPFPPRGDRVARSSTLQPIPNGPIYTPGLNYLPG
jgi:hypothetical protein